MVPGVRTLNDAGRDEQEVFWHASGGTREPDWQPVPPLVQPGYARPKSATPMLKLDAATAEAP